LRRECGRDEPLSRCELPRAKDSNTPPSTQSALSSHVSDMNYSGSLDEHKVNRG
jgi:hypothetical protein